MVERSPLTLEQMARIRVMAKTHKISEVARYFNKNPSTIYRALEAPTVKVQKPHPREKFTEAQKAAMVKRIVDKTATRKQVVKEDGISYTHLTQILEKAGVIASSNNHASAPKQKKVVRKTFINLEARYSGLSDGMF